MELFLENFANLDSLRQIYPLLLQGIELSVLLSLVSLPLALATGLLIAVLYSFEHRGVQAALLVGAQLWREAQVRQMMLDQPSSSG